MLANPQIETLAHAALNKSLQSLALVKAISDDPRRGVDELFDPRGPYEFSIFTQQLGLAPLADPVNPCPTMAKFRVKLGKIEIRSNLTEFPNR